MDAETEMPPPEARLIRTARRAAGLSAEAAAKSTGGKVSAAYWRDVERGYGWRRGERVKATASAQVLAHMARAVAGVTPERLESEGGRPDAAEILREILRSEQAASSPPLVPPGAPAPSSGRRVSLSVASVDLSQMSDSAIGELLEATGEKALMAMWRLPLTRDEKLEVIDGYLRKRDRAGGASATGTTSA